MIVLELAAAGQLNQLIGRLLQQRQVNKSLLFGLELEAAGIAQSLNRRRTKDGDNRAFDFFPENGASWNGQAFEGLQRFREICRGDYDLALDLRVDEDTRFLLKHVEAAARCGIGPRARYPFLDIALPPQFERRESEDRWISIEPHRFDSRMPIRTPFFHENDFSVSNTHLVFGPYILLPRGRFRAQFGLQLLTAFPRFSRAKITIDATRNTGDETVAVPGPNLPVPKQNNDKGGPDSTSGPK